MKATDRRRRPKRGQPPGYQAVMGRKSCKMCQLKLNDPATAQLIEYRIALGELIPQVADEFKLTVYALRRHWARHADQKGILKRVHGQARDIGMKELLARAEIAALSPMVLTDKHILAYEEDFQLCREKGDREGQANADRRSFAWVRLKWVMTRPIAQQFGGPQVNVVNNTMVSAAGPDFGRLFEEFERRLELHPPEKRQEAVALLREGVVIDAAAE